MKGEKMIEVAKWLVVIGVVCLVAGVVIVLMNF